MFPRAALVVLAGLLIGFGAVAIGQGDEDATAKTITVTAIVMAAAADAQEAATVQADGVLYKIVKDDKGKIVARDAGGKKAEIRGTLAEHDGAK